MENECKTLTVGELREFLKTELKEAQTKSNLVNIAVEALDSLSHHKLIGGKKIENAIHKLDSEVKSSFSKDSRSVLVTWSLWGAGVSFDDRIYCCVSQAKLSWEALKDEVTKASKEDDLVYLKKLLEESNLKAACSHFENITNSVREVAQAVRLFEKFMSRGTILGKELPKLKDTVPYCLKSKMPLFKDLSIFLTSAKYL